MILNNCNFSVNGFKRFFFVMEMQFVFPRVGREHRFERIDGLCFDTFNCVSFVMSSGR
jgi:hypothetical protein